MRLPASSCLALLLATAALSHLPLSVAATSYRLASWPATALPPAFNLVDQHGDRRSLTDYAGRVAIVLFGYTRCPDVCPGELFTLRQVLARLGPLASHVQVLFITLDPQHDTPSVLESYVTAFDPRFIGLTGSTADINAAAASFSVEFAKVTVDHGYTVDHSTGIYVIDPAGRLRLVGNPQTRVEDWIHDLRLIGDAVPPVSR
jgi:protein SCO1/2